MTEYEYQIRGKLGDWGQPTAFEYAQKDLAWCRENFPDDTWYLVRRTIGHWERVND